MSLADELAEERRTTGRNQIERIIDALDEADVRDFVTALHDINVRPSTLARVMARRGLRLDERRISDYRSGKTGYRYGLDGQRVPR